MLKSKKTVIISLGGSLIVPEELDWKFIKSFKKMIEAQIRKGYKFVIITGGGKVARKYIEAAAKIDKINNEDKDWIGIHATRMNGHFMRTIFRKNAHLVINKNPNDTTDFVNFKKDVLIAAGWKPGFSTDYDAVVLAKNLSVQQVINLSNIDFVYTKDPKKFKDAKKLENLSWKKYRAMVGNKWNPGMNAPFDPVASKLAEKLGLEVAILGGHNLKNFENYLESKKFQGTLIK